VTYTPLASYTDASSSPLNDIFRGMVTTSGSSFVQNSVMIPASMAIESQCNRRLTPFTGLVESFRAQNVDPDDQTDFGMPMSQSAMLGISRAQSLGATQLVRHGWLREHPVRWPDLWSGSISDIKLYWATSGSQDMPSPVTASSVQYEVDTGHVRFNLGTFLPQGSTVVATYSGGYSTVPSELKAACMLKATEIGLLYLEPESRPSIDMGELKDGIERLIDPYIRR
jgi:hypothetical protein